ncbi:I78 family peptidase inhibitor [Sphingomonas xinjiangensis]|uniref:Uncharacterized protein involved in type VI secretion and phage assembly n=1 Tax=Sphingomonas xinjiangensis TaxID=643568 RepID=A0A840YNT2_9SPHN|nr:I78 family peptidase inhibitor [Sphingomonas xinjiangensis]MBB5709242.1 uncharacterized protein involved in type VI secretion and phage assembly [Sphingomonas xinjiangensis]
MIRSLLPVAALACAACTQGHPQQEHPQTTVVAPPAVPGGACTKEGLAALVGKTRSEAVAAEALRLSGAQTLRWIEPGQAVTMDYREDRLNLHLDAQGKIERAGCS